MEEVEPALKEALACPGPIVLDCMIDQDLSVFPMVPAGAPIEDVFDAEDLAKRNKEKELTRISDKEVSWFQRGKASTVLPHESHRCDYNGNHRSTIGGFLVR